MMWELYDDRRASLEPSFGMPFPSLQTVKLYSVESQTLRGTGSTDYYSYYDPGYPLFSIESSSQRVAGRRLLTTRADFIIIINITAFTTAAVVIIITQKAGILCILLPVFLRPVPRAHTSLV
ncbi:hypothetical protein ARMSODRAFT_450305 [Armillaria solidipes]|uniref:Uncharacterized protein n=1 Tax=Armillaria solidipes TaxID=1076256 RepID=A0A2H3BMD8_9AGAR|nr:hypothetical protein ARMSODRAFT_450305 [Armillaria solidipes]